MYLVTAWLQNAGRNTLKTVQTTQSYASQLTSILLTKHNLNCNEYLLHHFCYSKTQEDYFLYASIYSEAPCIMKS